MHLYIYVCMYVYMYVYVCMCICVNMYAYKCVCVYMWVSMYMCIYVCIFVYMCVCVYVCMHVCVYASMRVCVYVCMCVCVRACVCKRWSLNVCSMCAYTAMMLVVSRFLAQKDIKTWFWCGFSLVKGIPKHVHVWMVAYRAQLGVHGMCSKITFLKKKQFFLHRIFLHPMPSVTICVGPEYY